MNNLNKYFIPKQEIFNINITLIINQKNYNG